MSHLYRVPNCKFSLFLQPPCLNSLGAKGTEYLPLLKTYETFLQIVRNLLIMIYILQACLNDSTQKVHRAEFSGHTYVLVFAVLDSLKAQPSR